MFSFELVYFASHAGVRLRLKIFLDNSGNSRASEGRINYWRPGFEKNRTRCSLNHVFMRSKFFVGSLLVMALAGGAFAAVVVEKKSRQVPYVEVFGCEGTHAFVFRGPTGTSRRPILVPPREYWTAQEAGLYSFVLRYHSGNVCSRLVTPEVFARYRVGDDFRDSEAGPSDRTQTEDSKSVQPVTHHRHRTAQLRKHRHASHRIAKHHRHNRSPRIAQR
jgi:hypothetical protein